MRRNLAHVARHGVFAGAGPKSVPETGAFGLWTLFEGETGSNELVFQSCVRDDFDFGEENNIYFLVRSEIANAKGGRQKGGFESAQSRRHRGRVAVIVLRWTIGVHHALWRQFPSRSIRRDFSGIARRLRQREFRQIHHPCQEDLDSQE